MAAFPIAQTFQALGQIGGGAVEIAQATGKYSKADAARRAQLEQQLASGKTLSRGERADILAQSARQQAAAQAAAEPPVGTAVTGPVAGAQVQQAAAQRAAIASAAGKATADELALARQRSRETAQAEVQRLQQAERERRAGVRGGIAQIAFAPLPAVGAAIDAAQQEKARKEGEVQAFRSDVFREYGTDPQFRARFDTMLTELQRVDPAEAAKIRAQVGVY